MYFVGLPEREKMAYATRVEALRRRFGQESDTSIALQELAGLRRGKNQSAKVLFVCGISLTSGQLISELFPDCTRSCFSQVVLRRRGGDRIYEMRCLSVAVGPNARFIVLPHWDNMS